MRSNKPEGLTENWNMEKDGNNLILGGKHTINTNLNVALDYRAWNPSQSEQDLQSFLFLSVEVKF